jgi:beta-lactamase regulating signal transducer with metallopeptidase domain
MLWWLVENGVMAGILACGVGLVCRVGRFRPSLQHALWLLVLARLVMPPLISWPWALPDLTRYWPLGPDQNVPAARACTDTVPEAAQRNPELSREALPTGDHSSSGDQAAPSLLSAKRFQAWLGSCLLGLWLAGSSVVLCLHIVRIIRFRRLLAVACLAPEGLASEVAELAARLRVRRPLTLILASIGSPYLWGLGRPRLLWPLALLKQLPPASRPGVIVHELAHLRRRDHWVGCFLLVTECLCWWNPVFWFIRRQVRHNAELACDAWVTSTLPEQRRAYAEALIEVTQLVSWTMAPAPALGMSSAARHLFERRLTMIMRERVPCRVPILGLVAIGLLGLLAVPCWSQGQPPASPPVKEQDGSADKPYSIALEWADDNGVILHLVEALNEGSKQPVTHQDQEQEKRLQRLEQQVSDLLKEIQALRNGQAVPQQVRVIHGDALNVLHQDRTLTLHQEKPLAVHLLATGQESLMARGQVLQAPQKAVVRARIVTEEDQAIALSRASYQLPHDKAAALAAFLRDHVKARVMEIKVEGDRLTVTTTPDAQKAIGGLVHLIQGKSTAAAPKALNDREAVLEGSLQLDTQVAPLLKEAMEVQTLLRPLQLRVDVQEQLNKPLEVQKDLILRLGTPLKLQGDVELQINKPVKPQKQEQPRKP